MPNEPEQNYLLKDEQDESIQVTGENWMSEELYLSDIALVAVMRPRGQPRDAVDHKHELYGILRRLAHLAMEHDLMRPVACVIPQDKLDDEAPRVGRWGSDQGWHGGAFTLYVEPRAEGEDKVKKRVRELVKPEPHELEEPREEPDRQKLKTTFLQKSNSKLGTLQGEVRQRFAELRDAVVSAEEVDERGEDTKKALAALEDCRDGWLKAVDEILRGRS